jgi:hypothetical protein
MFELKPLSKEGLPRALEKAERYRLLNEPWEAASICEDVLRIDPENQKALVTLLLALTDEFVGLGGDPARAQGVLSRIRDAYERAYYSGIVSERRAKAHLDHALPGSGYAAYALLREAMGWFEKAEALRPPGNDDAVLRWNTCARILMAHPDLKPAPQESVELPLE